MKSALFAAALVAGVAAQLQINTPVPGAAQCEPQLIQWSGGTPPYFVSIQTNPIGATPFLDFGQQTGNSLTWTVNDTIGASLIFQIKDSTGASQTSAPFNVIQGVGDSCLNGGSSGASAPASGSTGAATSPAGAPTGASTGAGTTPTSPAATSGSTKPGTSSTGSVKPSTSASPSGNAAVPAPIPAGILPACAAVLGAAFIALLA